MGRLNAAKLFLKAAVQIRAEFPDRPRVRVLGVERRVERFRLRHDGPEVDVPETVIRYELKHPDPDPGERAWQESTLVIREEEGEHRLLVCYNHRGLEFEPPFGGSGVLGLWAITLPLSLLAPVWFLWRCRYAALERSAGMTRYSRAAYRALAPQLDGETGSILKSALKRHCEEYTGS